jgi:predicted transcriptional regulator
LDVNLKQQGKSARETCPIWILNSLLREGKMSFEELIKAGEVNYSRGTINKYLGEEFEKGNVDRKGRRGKYFITSEGKKHLFEISTTNLEKANHQWMQIAVKLVQEGHGRILTNEELEKLKIQTYDLSKLVVEVDNEGLQNLGISKGQIMALEIVLQAAENLRKEGIKVANRVQGKNGFYYIGRI